MLRTRPGREQHPHKNPRIPKEPTNVRPDRPFGTGPGPRGRRGPSSRGIAGGENGMTSPPTVESDLRHPREWPTFVVSVALNLAIMAGAVALTAYGTDELAKYPRLTSIVGPRLDDLRALAITAVFALPAVFFLRNLRRASVRGGSVRLSADQLAEIHDILVRHCARLGVTPAPRLYLEDGFKDDARAFSSWDG